MEINELHSPQSPTEYEKGVHSSIVMAGQEIRRRKQRGIASRKRARAKYQQKRRDFEQAVKMSKFQPARLPYHEEKIPVSMHESPESPPYFDTNHKLMNSSSKSFSNNEEKFQELDSPYSPPNFEKVPRRNTYSEIMYSYPPKSSSNVDNPALTYQEHTEELDSPLSPPGFEKGFLNDNLEPAKSNLPKSLVTIKTQSHIYSEFKELDSPQSPPDFEKGLCTNNNFEPVKSCSPTSSSNNLNISHICKDETTEMDNEKGINDNQWSNNPLRKRKRGAASRKRSRRKMKDRRLKRLQQERMAEELLHSLRKLPKLFS